MSASSEIQVFHVSEADARKMLPQAIHLWLDISAHQARKLVETQRVQVDGNLCVDNTRRLNAGEVVRILPHPLAPPPRPNDVRMQYLDDYLVVIEKPAGMTSLREHTDPARTSQRRDRLRTVDEILPELILGRLGERSERRIKLPKILPVHRLDRDTSGLMVFARTPVVEQHLSQQFRTHTIRRRYLAVVHGDIEEPLTIETRFVEDRGDGLRGSTGEPDIGERAVTHLKPIERLGRYTLIECRLETGRTHQIRIHLSEFGHWLCGEKLYNKPFGQPHVPDKSGSPRLALHAISLGFTHPITGEQFDFDMPLPDDLCEFLKRLGSKLIRREKRLEHAKFARRRKAAKSRRP